MTQHTHWDQVYNNKAHAQLSWHQECSTLSYDWILEFTQPEDSIIDVGCGVSILADELLAKKYQQISLLELSDSALNTIKKRLKKEVTADIRFYHQDILEFNTSQTFKLWHDRAVFHFLTTEEEQLIYLKKLKQYLELGGYFLLATFAPDGPKKCSNLNTVQYNKDKISTFLGADFKCLRVKNEHHPHPNGTAQSFNYFLFQRIN
jgi:trans-aconitate methyltransferase